MRRQSSLNLLFSLATGDVKQKLNCPAENGRHFRPRGQATWSGRYILDGYAIADEYRMTDSSGDLIVLGMNFRTYDATRQIWNIKWLHALGGTWVDLTSEEMGGLTFDGQSITYAFKEPMASHAYTRAIYTNISNTHFTWRGEKSDDGKAWSEFMVVEAYRTSQSLTTSVSV
jgi:hypothetical protein